MRSPAYTTTLSNIMKSWSNTKHHRNGDRTLPCGHTLMTVASFVLASTDVCKILLHSVKSISSMSRKAPSNISFSPTAFHTLRITSCIANLQDLPVWYANWFQYKGVTVRVSSLIYLSIRFPKVFRRNYHRLIDLKDIIWA